MSNEKWEMFKNYMHNELGSFNIKAKIIEIATREFNTQYSGIRTELIKEIARKLTLVEK